MSAVFYAWYPWRQMMSDQEKWYSTDKLAELLGGDPSSLRRWRTSSPPQGPPFVRVSARRTRYRQIDVDTWLWQQRIDPADLTASSTAARLREQPEHERHQENRAQLSSDDTSPTRPDDRG